MSDSTIKAMAEQQKALRKIEKREARAEFLQMMSHALVVFGIMALVVAFWAGAVGLIGWAVRSWG